jgi:hypothetical protein
MLDILGILCSSICVIYVLIRTAQLDRNLPWFEDEEAAGQGAGPAKNSGPGSGSDHPTRRY